MLKVATTDGFQEFDELMMLQVEEIFHDRAYFPWDDEYDTHRAVWNGLIDHHPAVIVKTRTVDEITEIIRFCNSYNIKISVRGGGHHVSGSAVLENRLVIDLSLMNDVRVNEEEQTVIVEGGATWEDVDSETQKYGLAVPGGVVSDTGVAGLTLGGGYGWLRGKFGLSSDNVISFQVVLASGDVLWVDENSHPDLFWALRGGGGRFGIVTRFKFNAHKIGTELYMNAIFYHAVDVPDLMRTYQRITAELDPAITSMIITGRIPEDDLFPEEHYDDDFIAFLAVYAGDPDQGEEEMEIFKGLAPVILDISGNYSYTELQTFFDEDYPTGGRYYWTSIFANDLHEDLIEYLNENTFTSPSPFTTVDLWHMHGKSRQSQGSVPNRDAKFLIGIESNWFDSDGDEDNIEWNRAFRDVLEEIVQNSAGYTNFSSSDQPVRRKEQDFGPKYERLEKIRDQIDPDQLFSVN